MGESRFLSGFPWERPPDLTFPFFLILSIDPFSFPPPLRATERRFSRVRDTLLSQLLSWSWNIFTLPRLSLDKFQLTLPYDAFFMGFCPVLDLLPLFPFNPQSQ